jgi:hypothetical protein
MTASGRTRTGCFRLHPDACGWYSDTSRRFVADWMIVFIDSRIVGLPDFNGQADLIYTRKWSRSAS